MSGNKPAQRGQAVSIEDFITRWSASGAAERANYQLFLSELCDVIGVPRPNPTVPDESQNSYVFEKRVSFTHPDGTTTDGRIDLYKKGHFILEAKQGVQSEMAEAATRGRRGHGIRGTERWDDAMYAARGQADQYARALPPGEGWPPFLIVVDIGHSIELHAEFSCSGRTYVQFPDPYSYRFNLQNLLNEEVRNRLRAVWLDPQSLNPAQRHEKVTVDIAKHLAELAKSLETTGHPPEKVSSFLMRCLFTMFAEDTTLLPKGSFTKALEDLNDDASLFPKMLKALWKSMDKGGFSPVLRADVMRFNGGLFSDSEALPLTKEQLRLLIEASRADWREVEPAIFGTLLERALDPRVRHKLGAHFTPRAYVERIVLPTVIDPLREQWVEVKTAALSLAKKGDAKKAEAVLKAFHVELTKTRVLDPACGTGNFLYIALEHMKRLEGEILEVISDLGNPRYLIDPKNPAVKPDQFFGLEVNPRAISIAEVVLWIGYIQWHFRTRGATKPTEPVLRDIQNIELKDALLTWRSTQPVLDERRRPVTRWDGRTTQAHPTTGQEVPDETARVPVVRYIGARKAIWPAAEYVVGNPPFIGTSRMREMLGDGYTETLRSIHNDVPESCDYVLYWWNGAAHLLRQGKIKAFGFITRTYLKNDVTS